MKRSFSFTLRIMLVLAPLLFLTYSVFSRSISYFNETSDMIGDYPIIAMSTIKASHYTQLLGPYSRHKFNHPGPAYFYLYSYVTKVLNYPNFYGNLVAGQIWINFLCIAIALFAIAGWYPIWLLASALFPIFNTLALRSGPEFFSNIWGPVTLLTPTLAFYTTAAIVAAGHLAWLPITTIMLCLAVSNHLSTAGIMVPLYVVMLYCCAIHRERAVRFHLHRSEILILLTTLFILVLTAVGPIIEAFSNPNLGNIGRIISFSHTAPWRSPLKAWSFISSYFKLGAPLPLIHTNYLMPLILVIPWLRRAHTNDPIRYLRLFVSLSIPLLWFSALRIRGGWHPFIFYFEYSIVALAYLLVIWVFLDLIVKTKLYPVALLGCLITIFIAIRGLPLYHAVYGSGPLAPERIALSKLPLSKDELYMVKSKAGWAPLAQITYQLFSQGYHVCVPNRWSYMFGDDLTCQKVMLSNRKKSLPKRILLIQKDGNISQLEKLPSRRIVPRGQQHSLKIG